MFKVRVLVFFSVVLGGGGICFLGGALKSIIFIYFQFQPTLMNVLLFTFIKVIELSSVVVSIYIPEDCLHGNPRSVLRRVSIYQVNKIIYDKIL